MTSCSERLQMWIWIMGRLDHLHQSKAFFKGQFHHHLCYCCSSAECGHHPFVWGSNRGFISSLWNPKHKLDGLTASQTSQQLLRLSIRAWLFRFFTVFSVLCVSRFHLCSERFLSSSVSKFNTDCRQLTRWLQATVLIMCSFLTHSSLWIKPILGAYSW